MRLPMGWYNPAVDAMFGIEPDQLASHVSEPPQRPRAHRDDFVDDPAARATAEEKRARKAEKRARDADRVAAGRKGGV